MSEGSLGFGFGSALSIFLLAAIGVGMYGCPQYGVYEQRLVGEASLAHAQYNSQVQVQDAQGQLDASKLLAQRDVERAKGVAQSNAIIGDSLKNNESCIRWLFVEGLKETKNQVIYVPTEMQIPILEATRLAPIK